MMGQLPDYSEAARERSNPSAALQFKQGRVKEVEDT